MRKLLYLVAALVLMTAVACKPTEKTYREAYEKVMDKKRAEADEDIDSMVTGRLYTTGRPVLYNINGDTLETRIDYVTLLRNEGYEMNALKKFNIVVGQFRQLFNARAMVERLKPLGYNGVIVQNNKPDYYVVVGGSMMAVSALDSLRTVEADKRLKLLKPCPWVLEPAQMRR